LGAIHNIIILYIGQNNPVRRRISRKGAHLTASFTKRAIKDTFVRLLEERPLTDISVKDIVKECGINRNSFYYHFQDLPALIDELMADEADEVIRRYASLDSFIECFDDIIGFLVSKRRAIMHVYRAVDRATFERYAMKTCKYFVRSYTDTAYPAGSITDDQRRSVISVFYCLLLGMMLEWLENGMKETSVPHMRKVFEICVKTLPERASGAPPAN